MLMEGQMGADACAYLLWCMCHDIHAPHGACEALHACDTCAKPFEALFMTCWAQAKSSRPQGARRQLLGEKKGGMNLGLVFGF